METKVCSKCKVPKLLEEFGKKLDGRTSMCIECTRKQNRQYYKDNKDSIRKRQNSGYPKHAEKQKTQQKQFLKDNPEHGLLKLARQRCKKSGVPCSITTEDIVIPEFCPILGVRLEFGDMSSRDNSPSLDRITPELGYVPGNVAVISYRANRIKNEGMAEEHRRIADWMDAQTQSTEEFNVIDPELVELGRKLGDRLIASTKKAMEEAATGTTLIPVDSYIDKNPWIVPMIISQTKGAA